MHRQDSRVIPDLRCHFRVPKRGNRLDECEDASAVALELGRFALADGATEGGQSGPWAQMLVHEFLSRSQDPFNWANWLPELQQRWCTQSNPTSGAAALPWFVEVQLAEGAFSTFLGLVIEPSEWFAQAVGDSCLFQVRGNKLLEPFPVQRSADFTSIPWLLGSRTSVDRVLRTQLLTQSGTCQSGDVFWLMTDALAEWFLRQVELKYTPWKVLEGFVGQSERQFVDWVDLQRSDGQLRNDDVTLVGVSL